MVGSFRGLDTGARPLDALMALGARLPTVRRADLHAGDRVIVATRNSTYSLYVLEDGSFWAEGGWFDRNGPSPQRVQVNGCTFGGRAIKTDIVAAPGLFLEFDNLVTTTRIRDAKVVRGDDRHTVH